MYILVPLGLLALIGIPALIIIYIIKPRYQKRNITSTYIWKLSLKYRKRKIPLEWLQKSLLLLIQICVIGLIATVLIQPAVQVSSSEVEKAIILDVSYSMQATNNKETRLDRAIKQLEKDLNSVSDENKLTIILGKEEPTYLVRRESSVSLIKYALTTIEATYEECNFDEAIKLANTVIDENPSTMVYYYTDCQYKNTGYVKVMDFSNNEWNIAITDVQKEFVNGEYIFTAHVGNYNKNANAKLVLSIDDEIIETKNLSLKSNEEIDITFDGLDIFSYNNVRIELLDNNSNPIKDSLESDNIYFEQNYDNVIHEVELVGKTNTFMSSALKANGNVNIFTPKEEKEIVFTDKELYVFDSYVPKQLPDDGTVWFINPTEDIPNLDLVVGNVVTGDFTMSTTNNTNSKFKSLLDYVNPSKIEATQLRVIANTEGFDVLLECNGYPILLVGEYNNAKIVILALNLHYSNLPITMNFVMLIRNMLKYSVNTTTNKGIYNVGEKLTINAKTRTSELFFDNSVIMNSISYKDSMEVELNRPGIFEIKQVLSNGKIIIDKIFVKTPASESNFRYTVDSLAVDKYVNLELGIEGMPGANVFDYSKLTKYFAIALLLLIIVEWGVQYREQY
ncbi:MAG: BatA and WFA domain-containing protein [Erysipelotrichales bacterium]|nr:BatA and WFA domain-containing protein [Erysipelotrichales bacterium]